MSFGHDSSQVSAPSQTTALKGLLFTRTSYLDRNALPNARIQGIEEDIGLVGDQYNTAISVLFAGYIALQIPSNLLLTRVRPSIYLVRINPTYLGVKNILTSAACLYGNLGRGIRLHRSRTELQRPSCCAILPRIYGSVCDTF